jgi:NADH-quinone oxidoreductase subunit E
MSVRRLHPDQPSKFAFTAENLTWAEATIAKYPPGKQASAVIPLLMRAQEQHHGWLPEPALRTVAGMLGMAYIRVYEVATFYTQFQLAPVGQKAHVQVCGTTPCMLRGAEALKDVCRARIHHDQFHLSADGNFSWEEVECAGTCANAPMVQIGHNTYEDLTPALLERVIDGYAAGRLPHPGSQIGRTASAPLGGPTTLTDPKLYDGSTLGAWKARLAAVDAAAAAQAPAATASAPAPAAGLAAKPASSTPASATTASLATLAAGGAAAAAKSSAAAPPPAAAGKASGFHAPDSYKPELLAAPRGGKGDDLKLIWGVGEKLESRMNALGIWHFDQIATWSEAHIFWFETEMEGFKGRIARDKWIEQCQKLASGWRPEGNVGERPKG